MKDITKRDFSSLLEKRIGFSPDQIKLHLDLYNGYVKKASEILKKLQKTDSKESNYTYGEFTELKRRFPVAYHGVRLHELYFEAMTDKDSTPSDFLERGISDEWGSVSEWEKEMSDIASAGPGWAILSLNTRTGNLENHMITEHHVGWTVDSLPLVVLDGWEHAFMKDFGMDKSAYTDAFFGCLDWNLVNERFESGLTANGLQSNFEKHETVERKSA